jgi:hypothetical protein
VRAFVSEPWFADPKDYRCPHDSWLETFTIEELGSGERQQLRNLRIKIRLLGAYHNYYLNFDYQNVTGYEAKCLSENKPTVAHGDYLCDEIRYEGGNVVHEVVLSQKGSWIIACSDIIYTWKPIAPDVREGFGG